QLADLPARPTTVIYASGSGGTGAGLLLGSKLLDWSARDIRVTGICVCDNRQYFVDIIHRICSEFDQQFNTGADVSTEDIDIIDRYVGLGYGKSQPAELEVLRDLARREAIVLDPVYTGKAFYGLVEELRRDPTRFGQRVVFVHTGGIFGLFPAADKLAPLL
ncbi:MAG: pyridoxal-phosphate dependent enzyme, partial [Myxococcota bacterium]